MDWNKLGAIGSIGSFILAAGVIAKQLLAGVPLSDAGHSKLLLALIVSGFICGAIAILLSRKTTDPATHPGISTVDSFKQEQRLENVGNASATANPVAIAKYEEHKHYHYPSTQPLVGSTPTSPKPNIEFVYTRNTNLVFVGENYERLEETKIGIHATSDTLNAALACFRNIPKSDYVVPDAHGVRVHIRFFDSHENEVGDSRGMWLPRYEDRTTLELSDTRCLILIMVDDVGRLMDNAFKNFPQGYIKIIEVGLIHRNVMIARERFRLMDDVKGCVEAFRLPPPQ